MIVPISTLVGLLTISTLFETASGTPTKRNLGPLTTQFLGDKTRAGVSLTSVDDRNLVTLGGKSRRPVRIQFWCGADGPISMIPWYKTPGEPDLTAIHWTWGADPPYGTYKELHIEHGKEWINRIEYRVCGPANNKKVCFLYVGTINSEGNVQYILCGNDPTKGMLYP